MLAVGIRRFSSVVTRYFRDRVYLFKSDWDLHHELLPTRGVEGSKSLAISVWIVYYSFAVMWDVLLFD